LDIIITETLFDEDDPHKRHLGMNRAKFTEFLMRLAKYMYGADKLDEQITYHRHDQEVIKDREYDKHNMEDMRMHVAVGMLETPLALWQTEIQKI
jgi:hypothetical protein